MYYYFNDEVAEVQSQYRYIWSLADKAFIRYTTCLYDPQVGETSGDRLVVSQPLERLPVMVVLPVPKVFTSPVACCEWVRTVANNIPATYDGEPIIHGGYEAHRQPNGLIIDVSALTFTIEAPFGINDDGVILRVLDSNGEPIYPASIFEPGEKLLVADSPRQASMIIKHILALQL